MPGGDAAPDVSSGSHPAGGCDPRSLPYLHHLDESRSALTSSLNLEALSLEGNYVFRTLRTDCGAPLRPNMQREQRAHVDDLVVTSGWWRRRSKECTATLGSLNVYVLRRWGRCCVLSEQRCCCFCGAFLQQIVALGLSSR